MKHLLSGLGVALAAVTLMGCAAAQPPDPDAVQQWMKEQDEAAEGVDHMTGLASTTASAEAADERGEPEGVRIDMDEPSRISSVEFSCFGAETMTVGVTVATGSSTTGNVVENVPCAEGSITLEPSMIGSQPVSSISLNGYNDDGFGAWTATIR